jgi:cardiolipin synthase
VQANAGPVESDKAEGAVSRRVFTIPNVISFVRLLTIPLFLWLVWRGDDLAGLIVLVLAVSSDFVDGALARRLNQVSKLGQFLDPFADRLFIAAAVVALAMREVIPLWLVVVVMMRDALLGLGALVLSRYGAGLLPVKWMGKWATFALLFSLPLFLLGSFVPWLGPVVEPFAWAVALAGVALYWWVGFLYLFEAIGIARTRGQQPSRRPLR